MHALNSQKHCPLCRSPCDVVNVTANKTIQKQLDSTSVLCRNGCGTKCLLSKLRAHEDTCDVTSSAPPSRAIRPVDPNYVNRSTFQCPFCPTGNLTCKELLKHCETQHVQAKRKAGVCPICAAMPWLVFSHK